VKDTLHLENIFQGAINMAHLPTPNGHKEKNMKISIWKKRYPNWIKINPNNCSECKYVTNPVNTDAKVKCSCYDPKTRDDWDPDFFEEYEEDKFRQVKTGDGWLCFSFEKK
jgi:hypothetical protein